MNPLQIASSLREDYLKLLTTTFDPRQKPLKEAFQAEINTEGFLTREPYIALSQPYMHASAIGELLHETRERFGLVAEKPYKHQADATRRIMNGEPTVVATGTGSGKTEAFLMPIIDHCLRRKGQGDKVRAIIIYPMNALATDQNRRIRELLRDSGVTFGRYTGETKLRGERPPDSPAEERFLRSEFRQNPPNILLTNYQMLEYMLIRGDGRDILKDHEVSFVVLDEVHTYHGILGTDVSCLLRRLRAALTELNPKSSVPLYIGTSATLQSEVEGSDPKAGVAEFFTKLTGQQTTAEAVITETPNPPVCPAGLKFTAPPAVTREDIDAFDPDNTDSVRKLAAKIVGARIDDSRTPEELLSGSPLPYRLLDWLRKPRSLGEIVELLSGEPGRTPDDVGGNWRIALECEIEAALLVGPCLPDSCEFKLRPRVHRFLRGLARFWRCVNPDCGTLLQEGISVCTKCGSRALPLALCRTCGWDFYVSRYDGSPGDLGEGLLAPWGRMKSSPATVYIYDPPLEEVEVEAEEDLSGDEIEEEEESDKETAVVSDSLFDEDELPARNLGPGQAELYVCPKCLSVSPDEHKPICTCGISLRPVRLHRGKGTRCPICNSRYGRFDIITPVSLGNSSALTHVSRSVIAGLPDANRKLLVFCDSRQDAAHQARFVEGIERHLRLRRGVYELLKNATEEYDLEQLVEDLYHKFVSEGLLRKTNNVAAKRREKSLIEGQLLGEFIISPNVRASLERLALVRVRYAGLDDVLKSEEFLDCCETHKLDRRLTAYITPFILDVMRSKRAVNHEALTQRLTRTDRLASQYGLEIGREVGRPAAFRWPGDKGDRKWDYELFPTWNPVGQNAAIQKIWKHVHGEHVSKESLEDLLRLLATEDVGIVVEETIGSDKERVGGYQISYGSLLVEVGRSFVRCNVCGRAVANERIGGPCPRPTCSGTMVEWSGAVSDGNINALLLAQDYAASLLPAEHSAAVGDDERARIEDEFSANPPTKNMLVCTPTLELGINIGDLEAVAMRNMPPSPANYAQRAGRTGRSSRMGIVAGFSRNTPHDGYFFDHPDEIITGAIPPPRFNLDNLEAIRRHVHSLALESASIEFPATLEAFMNAEGDVDDRAVQKGILDRLIASAEDGKTKAGIVFGQADEVDAGWISKTVDELPSLIKGSLERRGNLIKGAALKKKELGSKIGMTARERDTEKSLDDLAHRLRSDYKYSYLPRVLAEDGILPGYAFSGDPGSLSLGFDPEPIFTGRVQAQREYAPGQIVYARGGRWQVMGLALNRPGSVNASKTESIFRYTECPVCSLANTAGAANNCSRCGAELGVDGVLAVDAGAFRAELSEVEPESEEERSMGAQDVRAHPQRNVPGRRYALGQWSFELRKQEELWWINHGPLPIDAPGDGGSGFRLCLSCGDLVKPPLVKNGGRSKGPKDANSTVDQHTKHCPGKPEIVSLGHKTQADTLRLMVPGLEPQGFDGVKWAWSFAYAIVQGAVKTFDIDEGDIEPLVLHKRDPQDPKVVEILWIDTIVGGSGILDAVLADFPSVAHNALRHLEGHDCPSACYRCLRTYANQRQWSQGFLDWRFAVHSLSAASCERIVEAGEVFASAHAMDSPEWVSAREAGFGSPLEMKLFIAAVDAGLASPSKQLAISDNGYLLTVADLAMLSEDVKLLIYVDGLAFHSSMRQRIHDAEQTKRLAEMGYTVLRFPGPRVYHDVSECVKEIRSALHAE